MTIETILKVLPFIAAFLGLFFGGKREWRFTGYWPLFRHAQDLKLLLAERKLEKELIEKEVLEIRAEIKIKYERIEKLEKEVLELRAANSALEAACKSAEMHLHLLENKDMVTAPPADFHWAVNLLVYNDHPAEFIEWLQQGIAAANRSGRTFVIDLIESAAPSAELKSALLTYIRGRLINNGFKLAFYFTERDELLELESNLRDAVSAAGREISPVEFYRVEKRDVVPPGYARKLDELEFPSERG
jgi:hypothetical protein